MLSKNIIRKFQTLQNAGIIKNAYLSTEIKNSDETNFVRVYLDIENETITNAQFKCFGGVLLTVCADEFCNLLINKNINEIEELSVADLLEKIGEVNDIVPFEFVISLVGLILKEYNKKIERENKLNNL